MELSYGVWVKDSRMRVGTGFIVFLLGRLRVCGVDVCF